jgi:hypothetical protein
MAGRPEATGLRTAAGLRKVAGQRPFPSASWAPGRAAAGPPGSAPGRFPVPAGGHPGRAPRPRKQAVRECRRRAARPGSRALGFRGRAGRPGGRAGKHPRLVSELWKRSQPSAGNRGRAVSLPGVPAGAHQDRVMGLPPGQHRTGGRCHRAIMGLRSRALPLVRPTSVACSPLPARPLPRYRGHGLARGPGPVLLLASRGGSPAPCPVLPPAADGAQLTRRLALPPVSRGARPRRRNPTTMLGWWPLAARLPRGRPGSGAYSGRSPRPRSQESPGRRPGGPGCGGICRRIPRRSCPRSGRRPGGPGCGGMAPSGGCGSGQPR